MPTRTIIDGYNLLWVLAPGPPSTADGWEDYRSRLISILAGRVKHPGDRFTVVFDGRSGLGKPPSSRIGGIEILFSRGKTDAKSAAH